MKRAGTGGSHYAAINVSRIPVGGGVAGLIIAAGVVVIALIGLPATRWFLAGSVAAGTLAALIRMWLGRR